MAAYNSHYANWIGRCLQGGAKDHPAGQGRNYTGQVLICDTRQGAMGSAVDGEVLWAMAVQCKVLSFFQGMVDGAVQGKVLWGDERLMAWAVRDSGGAASCQGGPSGAVSGRWGDGSLRTAAETAAGIESGVSNA